MNHRRIAALSGIVALAITAPALAGAKSITVRVEGLKRTLLPATVAHAESGPITKGGAPAGSCPGSSGAGYFDSATHHNWTGTYSSGLGVEITKILGETHTFSAKGYYWGIWVNNRFASAGLCDLKLKPGDQLLLAPAPGSGTTSPIIVSAPRQAKAGRAFTVRTTYYKVLKHGVKLTPLAGVEVTDGGAVTDRHGAASVTATKAGKLRVVATREGYVRAEATVTVTR